MGAVSVQACNTQMPGLSKSQGVFHAKPISYGPYDHNIGRLAQGVIQGARPIMAVHTHFTLAHYALLMRMQELNRVFYA